MLCAAALVACDDSGIGGSDDPCGDAEAIREASVSAYCDSKTEYCCYCQCWEGTGGSFDAIELHANATCACTAPPPSPGGCSGDTLDAAEHCLADEDSCSEVEGIVAEAQCEDSVI